MKKLLALSAIAFSISAVANTTPEVKVNIAGEVVEQTCVVDSGNAPLLVQLDRIKLSDLKNNVDNAKEFSVKFKGCDLKSTQPIFAAFTTNAPNVTSDGFLRNTSSGTNASTGVQIKIMSADGTKINLADPSKAKSAEIVQRNLNKTNGIAEFTFKAGYATISGEEPTTGFVTSSIPVTLQYQ